jgi:hypothetical protein
VTAFESETCEYGSSGGIMGNLAGIGRDPLGSIPAHVRELGSSLGMIGYRGGSDRQPIERLVAAERKFVFTVYRVGVGAVASQAAVQTCNFSVSFLPRAGAESEVDYSEMGSQCRLAVSRL